MHLSIVLTLHVGQLLVLLVLQGQLLVAILLDVVGEHVLALGLLLEGLSECLVDIDVGDIAVLEDDTEVLELLIQILDHLACHLALQVEHLTQPDPVYESSDAFIDFGIEKLIEAAGAQTVHEILNLYLLTWHAEREVQIDVDIGVVLGGAVMNLEIRLRLVSYWGVIVDDGLSQHASHTAVAAIAPLCAGHHNTGGLPARLLEGGQTCRDVKLEVETAAAVASLDHDDNRLLVLA